ncbi:M23 family metallopeptidase [Paraburkholderia bonniea]|uniref:M23 family metallopeptidase n=1 Tax=Paraburkholderia bonniea TaxID=2152891 RepID=UPI001291CE63|nr:M23 family metallopeptidase [Paraburkholderia bonniea]WJF92117.1 M23 family metallopeptidase [Paraburkholderia bonniea]WJF95437.1 M23 family metallopeptidase [Paraburkholderia bonniea]
MLSIFNRGERLSSGSMRFVTQRTACVIAVSAALGTAIVALAAGVAIGRYLPAQNGAGDHEASQMERDYAIKQLGKLNATVAQIEPRITRLATQVGALQDFEARLKTPKPVARAATGAAGDAAFENEGGPSLPPQRCADLAPQNAQTDARTTREQLACLAATLSALEQATASHAVAYAAFPGRTPVAGARFGSPFGNRLDPFNRNLHFHSGIDLAAPSGTPILAAAGGRVIFSGHRAGYGNTVDIDHGNGLVTRYGHAAKLIARAGDLVLPRQHIADVGSTGRSTGPHLHFEVLVNGTPTDPTAYLALFDAGFHG